MKGIGSLKSATPKISVVGDFVWLPYPHRAHARMGKGKVWARSSDDFILFEEFTVELIVKLCEARPRLDYHGEVKDYQAKSVPMFIGHLTEMYPRMLAQAAERSEHLRGVLATLTKVGRKAILQTLLPNVGSFIDRDKTWTWDGTYLTTSSVAASIFLIVKGSEVRLLPVDRVVVTVTDDGQVGPDTEFVD